MITLRHHKKISLFYTGLWIICHIEVCWKFFLLVGELCHYFVCQKPHWTFPLTTENWIYVLHVLNCLVCFQYFTSLVSSNSMLYHSLFSNHRTDISFWPMVFFNPVFPWGKISLEYQYNLKLHCVMCLNVFLDLHPWTSYIMTIKRKTRENQSVKIF